MYQLPKIIKHKGKLFREAGFSYANCKGYKYGNERILVEPDGSIFLHFIDEDKPAKEA